MTVIWGGGKIQQILFYHTHRFRSINIGKLGFINCFDNIYFILLNILHYVNKSLTVNCDIPIIMVMEKNSTAIDLNKFLKCIYWKT